MNKATVNEKRKSRTPGSDVDERDRGRRAALLLERVADELRGLDAGDVIEALALGLRARTSGGAAPRRRPPVEASDLDVARAKRLLKLCR